LQKSSIESARLDTLILLEDVLQIDRAHLLAHPERTISEADLQQLNTFITQRSKSIPLAYIRGKAAFFGREFIVDKQTLVPRPESEDMISLLLMLPSQQVTSLADIGTGSGCLGITAALERPQAKVYVYDTSAAALQVAAKNAELHQVGVRAAIQDLLQGDAQVYDVVLANLPYVPNEYPINRAASHEPPEALFSGPDGLEHYRRLWQQIAKRDASLRPQDVITEALAGQHEQLAQLAAGAGYRLRAARGLAQHFTTRD